MSEYVRQPVKEWHEIIAEKDAEIKRLRSALRAISEVKPSWGSESEEMYEIARAALEEEND